jgi:hypothetical protein
MEKKRFRVCYEVKSFVNVYVEAYDEDEAVALADEELNGAYGFEAYNTEILMNAELEDGEAEEMD